MKGKEWNKNKGDKNNEMRVKKNEQIKMRGMNVNACDIDACGDRKCVRKYQASA